MHGELRVHQTLTIAGGTTRGSLKYKIVAIA